MHIDRELQVDWELLLDRELRAEAEEAQRLNSYIPPYSAYSGKKPDTNPDIQLGRPGHADGEMARIVVWRRNSIYTLDRGVILFAIIPTETPEI
jgi:hypothetical protein